MKTADTAMIATEAGPFTAIVDADGAVLASGWTSDAQELYSLIHPSLRPEVLSSKRDLGKVTNAIVDYHNGDIAAIDDIAVHQVSGEFLTHAWGVLRAVLPGDPITYTEFAVRAGRPEAVRAAANACARNAAALFVPCHRILRIGGALGGFRYGLPVKRWLLDHEAVGR